MYIDLVTDIQPPTFESDHITYFEGVNDFISDTVDTIGKDNKYMKVVIDMLNDTKNPDAWTLDNIPLVSNL